MDEDPRGKRCEERHVHDGCRFHGHGTVVDRAEKVLTICFTRIGNGRSQQEAALALRWTPVHRLRCRARIPVFVSAYLRAALEGGPRHS